jgi:cell division protein FtsI/penicillin-binding protein 2
VLAELLGLPIEDLTNQLVSPVDEFGPFRIRLTSVTDGETRLPITVEGVQAGILTRFLEDPQGPDLSGLALVNAQQRIYPAGDLTGHLLGFVNQEGLGFFGVEGFYDDWLTGNPITVRNTFIPLEASLQPDPPAGVNLALTIDLEIQQMSDLALERAIERSGAESGQIIILDPKNGEILSMVAWPRLDPYEYDAWLITDEENERVISPGIAAQYEPGSTFKVLVMAAALEEGVVSPYEEFIDTGEIEIGGVIIRNWDSEAWGPQTMSGCIEHSLNVCLAYVGAQKLHAASFYSALQDFGIGSLTGVDLAGEVPGNLRTYRDPGWTEADLATNSFGQGVSVTPIQLLAAFGAVANGGEMVQPHVVRQVAGPKGVYWPKPTILGKPISDKTAQMMTNMLTAAVEGEGALGVMVGYQLAGKTGTAQIPTDYGYDPHFTVASFIGWGPVEDPRFLVYVRLNKPTISPWGSEVAAPVFKEIVEHLVIQLEIPPSDGGIRLANLNIGN